MSLFPYKSPFGQSYPEFRTVLYKGKYADRGYPRYTCLLYTSSHSILMSSHIIGDLEKVCDYITFIHHGKMIFSESKDDLLEQYRIVKCSVAELKQIDANAICGKRENQFGVEALVKANKIPRGFLADPANIEDIMLFTIRGEQ